MRKKPVPKAVQLTVRGVPTKVKELLYQRARKEDKSLNAILVEALRDSRKFVHPQDATLMSNEIHSPGDSGQLIIRKSLSTAAGVDPTEGRFDDLLRLAGTWQDDPDFDRAILDRPHSSDCQNLSCSITKPASQQRCVLVNSVVSVVLGVPFR
jgi:hypothetical protein